MDLLSRVHPNMYKSGWNWKMMKVWDKIYCLSNLNRNTVPPHFYVLNCREQDISETREDKVEFIWGEFNTWRRAEDGMQDMPEASEEESLDFREFFIYGPLGCGSSSLWPCLSCRVLGTEYEPRK